MTIIVNYNLLIRKGADYQVSIIHTEGQLFKLTQTVNSNNPIIPLARSSEDAYPTGTKFVFEGCSDPFVLTQDCAMGDYLFTVATPHNDLKKFNVGQKILNLESYNFQAHIKNHNGTIISTFNTSINPDSTLGETFALLSNAQVNLLEPNVMGLFTRQESEIQDIACRENYYYWEGFLTDPSLYITKVVQGIVIVS